MDEAIEMYDLATELGNTGPNFARYTAKMEACDDEASVCLTANLPPPLVQFKDAFLRIYAAPASKDAAQQSINEAMQLLEAAPNLTNWFGGTSCSFAHLTPLFFKVAEFSEENDSYWYWPNVWNADCTDVWASPQFVPFVKEHDLLEYWREVGWPDACRPEGDDFVCGESVE